MNYQEPEQLVGIVSSVIYHNEENGYSVIRLETEGGDQAVVVGCIPLASPGEGMTAWGYWGWHPTHGEQFKAEYTERTLPSGASAIFQYLSSRAVKGIGPTIASMIVARFGDDSLRVLRDEPERIADLKGIGRKKAAEISQSFRRQTSMRMLMEFLGTAGISPVIALRLYRFYGEDALDVVRENPYILSGERIGGSFAEADALAISQGMEEDAPPRITAALLFELKHNANNGHCFLPEDKLANAVSQLIGVDRELAMDCIGTLCEEGELIREPVSNVTGCYLVGFYEAEVYVAARLREMACHSYSASSVKPSLVAEKTESEQGISFAPLQRKTLEAAAARQLVVITGGPGTGKTTSVRAVLSLFDAMGLETMLAAPTGQAAKRLSEVTGREASTIHRLLEASFSRETDGVSFKKCETDKLRCSALILDECSMIDITLMKAVLAAIGKNCRLVMVGDADQLPSVGPGSVFRDIIRSDTVDTVRLTEIFRQSKGSRIVQAAHEINRGMLPDLKMNKDGFFFMRRKEPENAAETIVSLCCERLPINMGIPSDQIQILTPTRKGPAGTDSLNKNLQEALNPPSAQKNELVFADHTFREGDKVMQIRNDYDIQWKTADQDTGYGIFNGEIGRIVSIDPAAELITVDFYGREAEYMFEQLSELEHAWATTVHKSQGSEYRAVILAVSQTPKQLVYRGLLYTAVSRASELLVIVGDESILLEMTQNAYRAKRYSGLRFRLLAE